MVISCSKLLSGLLIKYTAMLVDLSDDKVFQKNGSDDKARII